MENRRTSKSPITFYGSGSYALLCFGKSARNAFSSKTAANVLAGKFRGPSDVRTAAKRLAEHGLLNEVSHNMWILTELGDDSIYQIADSFRSLRARMLGKTYVETKLREIRTGVSTSIDDFMDDEILEEMYIKTMEATKKKSANRKRNKKP
jgi:hypothetical protein